VVSKFHEASSEPMCSTKEKKILPRPEQEEGRRKDASNSSNI
jgi:hypothetical protein